MRRTLTDPEAMLWARLRYRLADNPVFRRQHPVGVYILDFYCPAAKLAVEIDGSGHGEPGQAAHDARRDRWLESQGVTVYRTQASTVIGDADQVADAIRIFALELSSPPFLGGGGPPPAGGVGGGPRAALAPSTTPQRKRGAVPLPRFAGEEEFP
jgi:very-short-patch-repair endonuclease